EDLAGGRPGDVLSSCGPDDAQAVVEAMARFYARWWTRPDIETRFQWLPHWISDFAGRQERLSHQLPHFLDRWRASIPPEIVAIALRLGSCYAKLLATLDTLPTTNIHADLHLDNIVFDVPDGELTVRILDWQSVSRGPAIIDIGPFIV